MNVMLAAGKVHVLRDPTRGGLATSLVEISEQSNVTVEIEEEKLPFKPAVRAACEMLGFDPLLIANEGKLVTFAKESDAEKILDVRKKTKYGGDAAIIGKSDWGWEIASEITNCHRRHTSGGYAARGNAAENLLNAIGTNRDSPLR